MTLDDESDDGIIAMILKRMARFCVRAGAVVIEAVLS